MSSDNDILNNLIENEKLNALGESLVDLCTWFPCTPNFKKWPINARKKGYKYLFYKPYKKHIKKIMLKLLLNTDRFSNIKFPIFRKAFPRMLHSSITSVQPMSLPSGLIFYLDYTEDD